MNFNGQNIAQRKFFLLLVAVFVFKEFSEAEGTRFPEVLKSHATFIAGFFPVSKNTVMQELRRRTAQDVCDGDYKFYFEDRVQEDMDVSPSHHVVSLLYTKYDHSQTFGDSVPCHVSESLAVKEDYLWLFVPFLSVDEEGAFSRTFCYGAFTDSKKEVFLPTCGNNIHRIESLKVEDDRLILRNGTDQLVLRMTYDPDCAPAAESSVHSWHDVRESPIFSLSGPFNSEICDILGPNVTLCQVVQKNSCLLSGAGQDYCFIHENVGATTRCEASMEILEMTGVFRQLTMIDKAPPVKAIQAQWLEGDRSIGMLAPCLIDFE